MVKKQLRKAAPPLTREVPVVLTRSQTLEHQSGVAGIEAALLGFAVGRILS